MRARCADDLANQVPRAGKASHLFTRGRAESASAASERSGRSGSIARAKSEEATGVPAADRIEGRGEKNAPRTVVRSSKAETRVVKTRHPPASFGSRGPEPFGPRPRASASGRRAIERRADEHEGDDPSGRADRLTSEPGAGSTRRVGCSKRELGSADVGSDASRSRRPRTRESVASDTRGLARTTSRFTR